MDEGNIPIEGASGDGNIDSDASLAQIKPDIVERESGGKWEIIYFPSSLFEETVRQRALLVEAAESDDDVS